MCDKAHCDGTGCEDCEECAGELFVHDLPQLVVLSDSVMGFTGDGELQAVRRDPARDAGQGADRAS